MSQFLPLVVSMGLLISNVSCAAVTAEQIMRKEVRSETQASLQLDASGKMQKASAKACDSDMCNYDFPLGQDGSCECSDPAKHDMIIQEEQCIEAAHEAGLTVNRFNFVISEEYTHHHPKGCFKDSCAEGQCYFYNPIGGLPKACGGQELMGGSPDVITGVPVCRRVNYLNGTVDSNGVDNNGGCDTDYAVITDEGQCTMTSGPGGCLGYCRGHRFRVTDKNQSNHNDFPKGCFIATGDTHHDWVEEGCVYFNPDLANFPDAPTNPKGTPICHVAVKAWKGGGGATGSSTSDVTARATAANGTHWDATAAKKAAS